MFLLKFLKRIRSMIRYRLTLWRNRRRLKKSNDEHDDDMFIY